MELLLKLLYVFIFQALMQLSEPECDELCQRSLPVNLV